MTDRSSVRMHGSIYFSYFLLYFIRFLFALEQLKYFIVALPCGCFWAGARVWPGVQRSGMQGHTLAPDLWVGLHRHGSATKPYISSGANRKRIGQGIAETLGVYRGGHTLKA